MWRGRTYENFDLVVSRGEGGRYAASVRGAPGGDGVVAFSTPFTEAELDDFFEEIGHPRDPRRRRQANVMDAARLVGTRLFETVFTEAVGRSFQQSLSAVRAVHDDAGREHGLRVRLNLTDVPELAGLPWEFLWSPSLPGFLLASDRTPVVRWLDREGVARPLPIRLPLRILCVFSEPTGVVELDVDREWESIGEALDPLIGTGEITLETLEPPITLDRLRWRLAEEEFNVLHFVGHGGYDPDLETGLVLFETERRREAPVPADHLAAVLADHDPLKLVVLNACEGARSGHDDVFNGTAQRLVAGHVPAVVGMQFEITDRAAIDLARNLYTALARGRPVDAALTEARKALYTRPGSVEWATPVLFMNAPDGRLFDISRERHLPPELESIPSTSQAQSSPPPDPHEVAREPRGSSPREPVPSTDADAPVPQTPVGDEPAPITAPPSPLPPSIGESEPAVNEGGDDTNPRELSGADTAPIPAAPAGDVHESSSAGSVGGADEAATTIPPPAASGPNTSIAPRASEPPSLRRGQASSLPRAPSGIRVLVTWTGLHAIGSMLGLVLGGSAGNYDLDTTSADFLLPGTMFGVVLGVVWLLAYRVARRRRRAASRREARIPVSGAPDPMSPEHAGRARGGAYSLAAHPANAIMSASVLLLAVATDEEWLAFVWLFVNLALLVAFAVVVRQLGTRAS